MPAFLPALLSTAVSAGATALAARNKPDIPEPNKPKDFYAAERELLRGIVAEGDPLREQRDRMALNRILTNASTEIIGPTGASTLAFRKQQSEAAGDQIAGYMAESSRLEQERVLGAQERLGQLQTMRGQDLDEYEQLKLKHEATEEVIGANFKAGLFRAGANLIGTGIEAYYDAQIPTPEIDLGGGGGWGEVIPENQTVTVGLGRQAISNMFGGSEYDLEGMADFNEPSEGLGFQRPDFRDLLTAEYPFTGQLRTKPLF